MTPNVVRIFWQSSVLVEKQALHRTEYTIVGGRLR
jgi:hypothetical protein